LDLSIGYASRSFFDGWTISGTRSGYFSRINCDFLTRSKCSLVGSAHGLRTRLRSGLSIRIHPTVDSVVVIIVFSGLGALYSETGVDAGPNVGDEYVLMDSIIE